MPHHIIIIHGIGKAKEGYSKPLSQGITREYQALDPNGADELVFHEVVWDDLVAVEQARLADVLRDGFGLAAAGTPTGFFSRIFGGLKRMINKIRTDFAAEFVEDVLSYREKSVYAMIHDRVALALDEIAQSAGPARFSIIAHSLGSVIASDHIYDRQKNGGTIAGDCVFKNFFTLGSPIALFALQYGGAALFKSPARLEDPSGVWFNIFDKDDPIAYPLKTLNDAYEQMVTQDVKVSTGVFGVAHVKYFDNPQVHKMLAQILRDHQ